MYTMEFHVDIRIVLGDFLFLEKITKWMWKREN